jgi:hypothetical protein
MGDVNVIPLVDEGLGSLRIWWTWLLLLWEEQQRAVPTGTLVNPDCGLRPTY